MGSSLLNSLNSLHELFKKMYQSLRALGLFFQMGLVTRAKKGGAIETAFSWTLCFLFIFTVSGLEGVAAVTPDPDPQGAAAQQQQNNTIIAKLNAAMRELQSNAEGFAPEMQVEARVTEVKACIESVESAQGMCLEHLSPDLREVMTVAGTFGPVIQEIAGAQDQCSEFARMLGVLNAGIGAYQAACSFGMSRCSTACKTAKEALTKSLGVCKGPQHPEAPVSQPDPNGIPPSRMLRGICTQKIQAALTATNSALGAACEGFKRNLASGVAALAGMARAIQQSKQCAKDVSTAQAKTQAKTVDCTTNPTLPQCPLNCSLEVNRTNPRCICEINPRQAGCPGAALTGGTSPEVRSPVTTGTDSTGSTNGPIFGGGATPDLAGSAVNKANTASGPGALVGSGGLGGSAGGRGPGGGTPGVDTLGASRINTNILEYSGGGGGGSHRGGGLGGGNRSLAGHGSMWGQANRPLTPVEEQQRLRQEAAITPAGGLTNWEKVKIRYQANRHNLLPE